MGPLWWGPSAVGVSSDQQTQDRGMGHRWVTDGSQLGHRWVAVGSHCQPVTSHSKPVTSLAIRLTRNMELGEYPHLAVISRRFGEFGQLPLTNWCAWYSFPWFMRKWKCNAANLRIIIFVETLQSDNSIILNYIIIVEFGSAPICHRQLHKF